jgi:hypothetical protein
LIFHQSSSDRLQLRARAQNAAGLVAVAAGRRAMVERALICALRNGLMVLSADQLAGRGSQFDFLDAISIGQHIVDRHRRFADRRSPRKISQPASAAQLRELHESGNQSNQFVGSIADDTFEDAWLRFAPGRSTPRDIATDRQSAPYFTMRDS